MPHRLRKSDKISILVHLPLFESCTQKELGAVASITVEATRPAGTVLTREGHDGGLMFVIVEGEAQVVAGAKPRVIGRLGPGDVVGELSLIDGQARSASVKAVTDLRVLEINADDFGKLFKEQPKFVLNLMRALSARVREMEALTT